MKKLRVKVRFRDERNFFVIHQEGDIVVVNDPNRVARLVEAGLCEEVVEEGNKAEESDIPALEPSTDATEKPKKATRKKKEA